MAKLPTKTADRISAGIKRFQPILAAAKSRDVGESDTVTIVVDILADIFGYDKYSEITSEHAIRGTYCDLATKLDGGVSGACHQRIPVTSPTDFNGLAGALMKAHSSPLKVKLPPISIALCTGS